ncbi:Secreted protein OS=Streptomyces tendae OX=1932 GN=GUR47_16720 PE=4 SV=1 [Streptomyces tendae]
MIWSAVLPGAALRVLRTAAGRRALHAALLVGGLFVLGLLCGGRAQAADEGEGPGTSTDAVGRVLDVSVRPRSPLDAGPPVQDAGAVSGPGSGALLADLRPVTEDVVRTVKDQVVRPVGDAVATVAEAVALPGAPGPSDPKDPSEPSDPAGVPDPADVPDLTDVPGLTDVLPGLTDPSDLSGRSPSAVPHPRAEPAPTEADASRTADPSEAADARVAEGAASPARVVGYGPGPGAGPAPAAHTRTQRAGTAPAEYAPAHPAPTGDPDGALGTASGADQGTPRHGDTHAVAPQHRLTFRLVPGAPERADAAGVREPYRDIPVSPA